MGGAATAAERDPREARERAGARREAGAEGDTEAAPTGADRLEELGDEIARLAAHLHAGRARFL